MKDHISPEEKLLRLIRGQKKENKPTEKSGIPRLNALIKYPNFFNPNKLLMVAFALACLYLLVSFVYPLINPPKVNLPKVESLRVVEPNTQAKEDIKPYEYYAEAAKNRQIFSGVAQSSEKPAGAVNVDLTKDINLLGIISGDNPQAIIEDVKTKKTYYLSKGQFINDIQVEDIQEGKIILNYNGQSFELYL